MEMLGDADGKAKVIENVGWTDDETAVFICRTGDDKQRYYVHYNITEGTVSEEYTAGGGYIVENGWFVLKK